MKTLKNALCAAIVVLSLASAQADSTITVNGVTIHVPNGGTVVLKKGVVTVKQTATANTPSMEIGSGRAGIERRTIDRDFTKLKLAVPARVVVKKGSPTQPTCELRGEDNIVPLVNLELIGDLLAIGTTRGFATSQPLEIELYVASLSSVSIEGAGQIELEAGVINPRSLELMIRGSGSMTATGIVESLDVDVSDAGDVDCLRLKATRVNARVQGAGDVRVFADTRLDVELRGAGKVVYRGNPTVSKSIQGAGKIVKSE
jgi:hypothetical protein